MTISTTSASTTILGTGALSIFNFSFIADSAADIVVVYTNASGVRTTLSPSQYTLVINPPATGQIWGIGGTVTYPIVGPPIALGTSITISRVLPLTQLISISDQGDFSPEVIEQGLDTLTMQLQQIAATASGGASASPPAVFTLSGIGGTANVLTASTTNPSNFSLNRGILVTFTPTQINTTSSTLNIQSTGAITLQKNTYAGTANLAAGDLAPGIPVIAQYTGTTYLALNITPVNYEQSVNTAQAIAFGNNLDYYVATGAFTATIASSLTLLSYWYVDFFAQNGAISIAINSSDKLNNGSVGVGITMPIGSSGRMTTDANGNLYLDGTYNYAGLASPAFTGTPTAPTPSASSSSTTIATTAFANPGSVLTSPGYFKLPGGGIIQFGTVHTIASSATFFYPIPFPNSGGNTVVTATGLGGSQTVGAATSTGSSVVIMSTLASVFVNVMAIGW